MREQPEAGAAPPVTYTRFGVGTTEVVCAAHIADALRAIVATSTVYEFAARHPARRALAGRGTAYAIPLPGHVEQAVVRHNRHGGLLAPITGDLFRSPTRAPLELRLSQQLIEHGVPTPLMLGYALYPTPFGLCRVDVVTREVAHSFDLAAAFLAADATQRAPAIAATVDLVRALAAAGAHHADLNVKNVLLHPSPRGDGGLEALVLDLDRITFGDPGIALERNLARLLRSARKWQGRYAARVTQVELDALAAAVRDGRPAALAASTSS